MKVHIQYDDGAVGTYPPPEYKSVLGVTMVEPLTAEGRLVMHFGGKLILSRCSVYSFSVELNYCKRCGEVLGGEYECAPWTEGGHG